MLSSFIIMGFHLFLSHRKDHDTIWIVNKTPTISLRDSPPSPIIFLNLDTGSPLVTSPNSPGRAWFKFWLLVSVYCGTPCLSQLLWNDNRKKLLPSILAIELPRAIWWAHCWRPDVGLHGLLVLLLCSCIHTVHGKNITWLFQITYTIISSTCRECLPDHNSLPQLPLWENIFPLPT